MYNVWLKVWNTYYLKNIDMFNFVETYTFDLLEFLSLKNKFNYILFKNSWKNTCELSFWNWHYHPIMGPIQNMEAMFQTWKNIIFKKDLHLGPTSSFYYECTHLFYFSPKKLQKIVSNNIFKHHKRLFHLSRLPKKGHILVPHMNIENTIFKLFWNYTKFCGTFTLGVSIIDFFSKYKAR